MAPKLVTSAAEVEAALPYADNKEFNARWCIETAEHFEEGRSEEERTAFRLYARCGTALWRESQREKEAEKNAKQVTANEYALPKRSAQLVQDHTEPQASLDIAQASSSTLKQISPSQEAKADAKSRVEDTSNQDAVSRSLLSASTPLTTSAMLSQSPPKPASSAAKAHSTEEREALIPYDRYDRPLWSEVYPKSEAESITMDPARDEDTLPDHISQFVKQNSIKGDMSKANLAHEERLERIALAYLGVAKISATGTREQKQQLEELRKRLAEP